MKTVTKQITSRTSEMNIGNITYIVTTHYNKDGRETAEQKLLRLVTDRVSSELKNSEKSKIQYL